MSFVFFTQAQTKAQKQRQQEDKMFKSMTAFEEKYGHDRIHDREAAQTEGPALFKGQSYSSLSKSQQKAAKKQYKQQKARNSFVTLSDMDSAYMQHVMSQKVTIGDRKTTQGDLYDRVRSGECDHMQQLDSVLRNRAATEYMLEHKDELAGEPQEVVKRLKSAADPMTAMMNPLLRMGISCMINSSEAGPETKEKYRKLDELLNKEIMVQTICKIPGNSEIGPDITEEARSRSINAQRFMFKAMLTCQLGKLQKKDSHTKPPTEGPWQGSVANAFAHCSRVMITLPGDAGADYSPEAEKQMYERLTDNAGFVKRGGATHTMSRKKREKSKGAKEIKFFSPRSQYGLNVAVGGLGNAGIPGGPAHAPTRRLLKNDGSCGHLFMHYEEGTKRKHAGMLLGFESDAYGVMNQTGHVHDKKATGEFASSFGGQRCDEIGDKYGGRVVDLSGCDADTYTSILEMADSAFANLLMKGRAGQDTLEDLTRDLCGDLMDETAMNKFMTKLFEAAGSGPHADLRAAQCLKDFYKK
ncbi:MAG: hypothetical protein K6A92_03820 [Lachnospiraceae bacterium]|nr:hypothetical protein [Lachnospiraceae bacterium]